MERALDFAGAGTLRAPIDAVMPLVWLPEAFTLIGEGRVTGKLVIDLSLP